MAHPKTKLILLLEEVKENFYTIKYYYFSPCYLDTKCYTKFSVVPEPRGGGRILKLCTRAPHSLKPALHLGWKQSTGFLGKENLEL